MSRLRTKNLLAKAEANIDIKPAAFIYKKIMYIKTGKTYSLLQSKSFVEGDEGSRGVEILQDRILQLLKTMKKKRLFSWLRCNFIKPFSLNIKILSSLL